LKKKKKVLKKKKKVLKKGKGFEKKKKKGFEKKEKRFLKKKEKFFLVDHSPKSCEKMDEVRRIKTAIKLTRCLL